MSSSEIFDLAVAELMDEFGFLATYMQGTGTYNPSTGVNNISYREIQVQAIQMDLNLRSNGVSVGQGTLIQDGDKQLFIRPPNKTDTDSDPITINPEADKIKINNTVWRILTSKEINTDASNQILFELYIRR
jgi:hypothetical protein